MKRQRCGVRVGDEVLALGWELSPSVMVQRGVGSDEASIPSQNPTDVLLFPDQLESELRMLMLT